MPDSVPKILVADDDEGLLHTLGWILKDKGYEVVPVKGGIDLLKHLDLQQPDLLLLDIMMPKIDGLQLLELVKGTEDWRDLPVLMISSMPPEEATVRALGLGAADFISKPFRVRELLARIDARLKQSLELRRVREEAKTRAEVVDILHEVTDSLKPDEIYHILTRRRSFPPNRVMIRGCWLPHRRTRCCGTWRSSCRGIPRYDRRWKPGRRCSCPTFRPTRSTRTCGRNGRGMGSSFPHDPPLLCRSS